MNDDGLVQRLYDSGAEFSGEIVEQMSPLMSFIVSWVLPVVLFVVLGQLLSRQLMKKMGGPNAMKFDIPYTFSCDNAGNGDGSSALISSSSCITCQVIFIIL